MFFCDQVTVTPDDIRIAVFNSGMAYGSTRSILNGGQTPPPKITQMRKQIVESPQPNNSVTK